jgi:hypothetical protein
MDTKKPLRKNWKPKDFPSSLRARLKANFKERLRLILQARGVLPKKKPTLH